MDSKLLTLVPVALMLSFCQTTHMTGSLCPVGPFIADPGASDRLTRAEKEYVVTLNTSGEAICGWTAPKQ